MKDGAIAGTLEAGQHRSGPAVVGERSLLGRRSSRARRGRRSATAHPSASARSRDVSRAVRAAVEIHDVRVGAVARHDDDQRLGGRRRSIRRGSRRPGCRRSRRRQRRNRVRRRSGRTCSSPRPTRCRSTFRSRRGDGPVFGRPGRSRRPPNRAGRPRQSGAEIAMDRSIPACCPVVVCRSAGVTRTATSVPALR